MVKVGKIILVSSPFFSQLAPTIALARAFLEKGVKTAIACTEHFRNEIVSKRIKFIPLAVSRNINTGIALRTRQTREQKRRLNDFLKATKRGAIETLMIQTRDRQYDMLFDPDKLRSDIQKIHKQESPDLWLINQLSYSVTLALYCLRLPFVTLCIPHPTTIPDGKKIYGVPAQWPKAFKVNQEKLARLKEAARKVEKEFTDEFNSKIERCDKKLKPVSRAFSLTSSDLILYNYPDLSNIDDRSASPKKIFMGYCFEMQQLPEWYKKVIEKSKSRSPKILIVMGTFLSYRNDVIGRCIRALKEEYPESLIIAAAGASTRKLRRFQSDDVLVEEYVPQKGLLPYMDVVIHHGGNNSFTESLYFGKPMVIMPFSSDQFDIASDAEELRIAGVLNPNSFGIGSIKKALRHTLSRESEKALLYWKQKLATRGPRYAVRRLLSTLSK